MRHKQQQQQQQQCIVSAENTSKRNVLCAHLLRKQHGRIVPKIANAIAACHPYELVLVISLQHSEKLVRIDDSGVLIYHSITRGLVVDARDSNCVRTQKQCSLRKLV